MLRQRSIPFFRSQLLPSLYCSSVLTPIYSPPALTFPPTFSSPPCARTLNGNLNFSPSWSQAANTRRSHMCVFLKSLNSYDDERELRERDARALPSVRVVPEAEFPRMNPIIVDASAWEGNFSGIFFGVSPPTLLSWRRRPQWELESESGPFMSIAWSWDSLRLCRCDGGSLEWRGSRLWWSGWRAVEQTERKAHYKFTNGRQPFRERT